MLQTRLNDAIRRDLPGVPFVFGVAPDPVATLPCPCDEVGTLAIYDDGDEATVSLSEITHSHYNPYDGSLTDEQREQRLVAEVLEFLHALFADQVLLYRTKNRERGGWRRLDRSTDELPRDPECEYFLWSRPAPSSTDA